MMPQKAHWIQLCPCGSDTLVRQIWRNSYIWKGTSILARVSVNSNSGKTSQVSSHCERSPDWSGRNTYPEHFKTRTRFGTTTMQRPFWQMIFAANLPMFVEP